MSTSTASKGLVLVTGANGYIAARTVEAFLDAGFSVRGTVRSLKSAEPVAKALAQYGDRLSFVAVPDITVPGAFAEAIKGVTAVAHLATPVSLFFTDPEPVLRTALSGTRTILDAALTEPAIKHVVLMSSITAVNPHAEGPHTMTEEDWCEVAPQLVAANGKDAGSYMIYAASKVMAEKAFWEFRDEHKPAFTMTALNPVLVAGPPLVIPESRDKIGETYAFIHKIYDGGELNGMTDMPFHWYVDVRDVARLTVAGVERGAEMDGGRFIVSAGYGGPQAVADALRERFPERQDIIREGKKGEGYNPGFATAPGDSQVNGDKSAKLLGGYIPWDQMAVDTAVALKDL